MIELGTPVTPGYDDRYYDASTGQTFTYNASGKWVPARGPGEPRLPSIDSVWHWEPMKSTATQRIKVVQVRWNGEEWMVGTVAANVLGWHDDVIWNDWDRFIEAAVLVEPGES